MKKIPFKSCKNPQNCLVPRKSASSHRKSTAASRCYPAQIGHRRTDMACAAPRLQTQHLSCALLPLLGNKTRLASNVRALRRPHSNVRLFSSRPQARRGFPFREDETASPSDLNFEPPLRIVEYPDPILRARNKRIVTYDENLKKLVAEMFDVMYRTDGVGLSAPQVGINVQLLVFNPAGERGEGEEIVLINPKVHKYSKKTVPFNEGCLSFPGIYADVERPESVKVDARDITGARFSVNISGLPARVFQHEFDHLQGILFFDRMTVEVLDSIRPELQALEKKFETRTGSPSPEKIDSRETRKAVSGFGRS